MLEQFYFHIPSILDNSVEVVLTSSSYSSFLESSIDLIIKNIPLTN